MELMGVRNGILGAMLVASALSTGCHSSHDAKSAEAPCRAGPKDDVAMAARTGVSGAKTGVETGVEGVKTFGSATAGWVEGGSDEASRRWEKGKQETKDTAHSGASETRAEGSVPPCH